MTRFNSPLGSKLIMGLFAVCAVVGAFVLLVGVMVAKPGNGWFNLFLIGGIWFSAGGVIIAYQFLKSLGHLEITDEGVSVVPPWGSKHFSAADITEVMLDEDSLTLRVNGRQVDLSLYDTGPLIERLRRFGSAWNDRRTPPEEA